MGVRGTRYGHRWYPGGGQIRLSYPHSEENNELCSYFSPKEVFYVDNLLITYLCQQRWRTKLTGQNSTFVLFMGAFFAKMEDLIFVEIIDGGNHKRCERCDDIIFECTKDHVAAMQLAELEELQAQLPKDDRYGKIYHSIRYDELPLGMCPGCEGGILDGKLHAL